MFNGLCIEFVSCRFVISKAVVFYGVTYMCNTMKAKSSRQPGEAGQISFNDKSAIYRQIALRLREKILEGVYQNGDAMPSVRQIASEQRINPITVSKASQILVNDDLLEKKRGLGMYVGESARVTITER